jgi:hypothetical protein
VNISEKLGLRMKVSGGKKIDVVNLEWSSKPSRDRLMATLVCNYLRLQGLSVLECSVFDGFHVLDKIEPRLFFITNTLGAPENLELTKYAKSRGALCVSLISEGNFIGNSNTHKQMIWGWNGEKVLHEDLHLQWSERTRDITLALHPELEGRVLVSGGVGFDNYTIDNKVIDKNEYLNKWGKSSYEKVVGVGCWDFGWLYPEDPRYSVNQNVYSELDRLRFLKDGEAFDEILANVAAIHPDCLFLIKQHPGGILGHKGSGTTRISTMPNVVVVKNQISIHDCILISDFWIVYESTTAMEAWLSEKQTCLLNPSGRDFPRDVNVSEGSPAYTNAEQLSNAIDAFYKEGHLPKFNERESDRRRVIKQIIQWDDGLNHVRAGNAILNLLEDGFLPPWRPETLKQFFQRLRQHVKWELSPYFYKFIGCNNESANRKYFVTSDLEQLSGEKLKNQKIFYKFKKLDLHQLRKLECE